MITVQPVMSSETHTLGSDMSNMTTPMATPTPPETIVAFGDSITKGYGATVTYEQYLSGLMPVTTIISKGVNGDITAGMLRRFQSDVIANAPQYVIILGGVNDINIYVAFSTTTANLQSMYTQAAQNGITPVLCTVTPDSRYTTAQKNSIINLNAWITSYAASHNLPLVDLYVALQDPARPGNLNPAYDSGDGLHPNNAGYQRIANTIYNTVFASPTVTPTPTPTPKPTTTPAPTATPGPSPTVTPSPTPVPGQGPVTSGMVLWYDLGQSGSTLTDKSGKGNTGTVHGTTLTTASGGQVRHFDGTTADYVSTANSASLNPTTGLTVDVLFKLDHIGGLQGLVSKSGSSSTGNGYTLWVSGDRLQWYVYDINSKIAHIYSPTITTGQWYHATATCDGTTMTLYLNGAKVATTTVNGMKPSTLDLTIGRTPSNGALTFQGSLATVRVYGRSLSVNEVIANYNTDASRVGQRPIGVTPSATPTATPAPSITPTPKPTSTPTPKPTLVPTPTPAPTATPRPSPTITPSPTPVPGQGPVTSGMALWYDMGQSDSTLTDKSGKGNTGTIHGTTLKTASGGQVRHFDGTTADYVSTANSASLNPTTGLTVEVLFKLDHIGGLQSLVSKSGSSSTGEGYTLWVSGNRLQWYVYDKNGKIAYLYSPTITTGQWYHATATFNGSTMTLYMNGVKVASGNCNGLKPSTLNLMIGRNPSNGALTFQGSLATVRVYGRSLSGNEVIANYNTDASRVGQKPISLTSTTTLTQMSIPVPFAQYVSYDLSSQLSQIEV